MAHHIPTPNPMAPLAQNCVHETTPLLFAAAQNNISTDGNPEQIEASDQGQWRNTATPPVDVQADVSTIILVLLIGVFVANADTSLCLATYGQIASEFQSLDSGSWLLTSYMVAMCVVQPLYGKLSDVFGRKAMLQVAYCVFSGGCICTGVSRSMGQIVVARAIQGIGGAGMVSIVAIILSDLVPLRDVALYRGYVNVIQTVRRSCGGALGGALAQIIGWRWTFLGQVPLVFAAVALVAWRLQEPRRASTDGIEEATTTKLRNIDFVGALCLSATILATLIVLDIGGKGIAWTSPLILCLVGLALLAVFAFWIVERRWAKQPIFPLHLLGNYDVAISYMLLALGNACQTGMIFIVPLFFQITKNASTAAAGAYLLPAIIGNTIGGLISGFYIKRTGLYKVPTIISGALACGCYTALIIAWRRNITPWQALLTFPGGFAVGISHSALFIYLGGSIDPTDLAVATGGFYLCGNMGSVAGLSAIGALFQKTLRTRLEQAVGQEDNSEAIVERSIADIKFVQHLSGRIRDLVLGAYLSSFRAAFCLSLGLATALFIGGLMIRQHKLK